MRQEVFLTALLGGQLLLIGLDVLDGWRHRAIREREERLQFRSVVFLGATILAYGALQYGGLALAPSGEELLMLAAATFWPRTGVVQLLPPSASMAVLIGVVGFYVAGFWDYVVHRYVNHSRLLWFSHENHHLPTRVSVYMPGICVRPFAVVAVFPATAATIFSIHLALTLTGADPVDLHGVLYAVVLAQVTVLGTSHSSFLRRCRWVHRMLRPFGITTPQEHRLHHTPDLQGNFGNFTTLWDRVFRTYLDPADPACQGHRAGLSYDQDFLGTITLGLLKLPSRWRRHFQVAHFCYLR